MDKRLTVCTAARVDDHAFDHHMRQEHRQCIRCTALAVVCRCEYRAELACKRDILRFIEPFFDLPDTACIIDGRSQDEGIALSEEIKVDVVDGEYADLRTCYRACAFCYFLSHGFCSAAFAVICDRNFHMYHSLVRIYKNGQ